MEDNNLSKGLFGLNRKEVESYIAGIKSDYENELSVQNKQLQEMKIENIKLTEQLNKLMKEQKELEASKANISDVLLKAQEQAKQIIDDARKQSEKEKEDVEVLIEEQREKLIDAKIELAMLKDKAKEIISKFSDDLSKLQ